MECLAVIAVSAAVVFARFAMMQELNPFLWGALAVACYVTAPLLMIRRGAGWIDAPWVWLSSFGALAVLFAIQCVVGERQRYRNRGGAAGTTTPRKKLRKTR